MLGGNDLLNHPLPVHPNPIIESMWIRAQTEYLHFPDLLHRRPVLSHKLKIGFHM